SLWFGIAKSNEVYEGLDYVIQIGIAKVDITKFRKDMFKAKRKEISEMWSGEDYGIANIVRFAPSACNSQPWFVESKDNTLEVFRRSKSGKVGIMPKNASIYFNQIDIGIFMCFLELCLDHECIKYERYIYKDKETFDNNELNAKYMLTK
ncbi:MAG: nitroreductase family protein, partial [Erysipelotrichaceae bacterium]|nr:nitroreductase family protein [Erysipelotrichaceae bacterium]